MSRKEIAYIAIIIALVVIWLTREGCNASSRTQLISDVSKYKTEATYYKGKDGVEIAQNNALALDNQEQIESILQENDTLKEMMENFSKLNNVTVINNKTEIRDSIYFDTIRIPCDFEPFPVYRDCTYYQFAGTIAPEYFKIDSLIIPDEESIVFGKRKQGFLKRREYKVEVVHSNPKIRTTNIGTYYVKPKRNKFVLSAGVTYGLDMNTGEIHPVIGLTAGFPLIVF